MSVAAARADYTVIGEQFDFSKVVHGKGEVFPANATLEKHLKTVKSKHFFGFKTPVDFAVEIPIGGDGCTFKATIGPERGSTAGAVVAKVLGDGRLLWTSEEIPFNATKDLPVKVDVKGVKNLTLAVDPVGENCGATASRKKVTTGISSRSISTKTRSPKSSSRFRRARRRTARRKSSKIGMHLMVKKFQIVCRNL